MDYTKLFDAYVCDGDSIEIEVDGKQYRATIHHDSDSHIDDDDMHNLDQSVTGCDDEQNAKMLAARTAWDNDEWFYCGIVVTELCAHCDNETKRNASLWGIEANYPGYWHAAYLTSVAHELVSEVA